MKLKCKWSKDVYKRQVEYSWNGIYDLMRSTNYYSGRMIYYGDVTGDDAQSIKTGKRTTCLLYTSRCV